MKVLKIFFKIKLWNIFMGNTFYIVEDLACKISPDFIPKHF